MVGAMQVAMVLILVYAAVLLVGGVLGYRLSGSRPSLISGTASAVVLTAAYFLARTEPSRGLWLAAAVALVLAAVFLIRLFRTGSFMPAGMLLILSLAALTIFAMAARSH